LGNTPAPYAELLGDLEHSTRDSVQGGEPEHHHRGTEAAAVAAVVAGEEHHRHEGAERRHEYSNAPISASTADYSAPSQPHESEDDNRGVEAAAVGTAAAVKAHDHLLL
jgi:hypothetical protein